MRHGQSAGNVARDAAHEAENDRIISPTRDADIPLSDLGCQQAASLGHWFASQPEEDRPQVLLSCAYLRAFQTGRVFRERGGAPLNEGICFDERLREKEFGLLDGLTTSVIAAPDGSLAVHRAAALDWRRVDRVMFWLELSQAWPRVAPQFTAPGWACWLHGRAGGRLSETVGPLGFLTRDLLPPGPSVAGGICALSGAVPPSPPDETGCGITQFFLD